MYGYIFWTGWKGSIPINAVPCLVLSFRTNPHYVYHYSKVGTDISAKLVQLHEDALLLPTVATVSCCALY